MKLEFALFGETATVTDRGEFSVLNAGWEWLSANKFPATAPGLSLIAKLSATLDDCGIEHQFTVTVIDPDGEELTPNPPLPFTPRVHIHDPGRGGSFTIRSRFDGFIFEKLGKHRFRIAVDDTALGEIILETVVEKSK